MQSGLLLEHTFRFFKQQLGWDRPLLRAPAAADLWTWLIIAVYVQLYLATWAYSRIRPPSRSRRMTWAFGLWVPNILSH